MINHPSQYYWSSFHSNALGKFDALIEPHEKYYALGENLEICQKNYLELFKHPLQPESLDELRSGARRRHVS